MGLVVTIVFGAVAFGNAMLITREPEILASQDAIVISKERQAAYVYKRYNKGSSSPTEIPIPEKLIITVTLEPSRKVMRYSGDPSIDARFPIGLRVRVGLQKQWGLFFQKKKFLTSIEPR